MRSASEDQIRQKAYELWEADGRPEGRDEDYWFRSARALENLAVNKPAKRPRAISRKSKAA